MLFDLHEECRRAEDATIVRALFLRIPSSKRICFSSIALRDYQCNRQSYVSYVDDGTESATHLLRIDAVLMQARAQSLDSLLPQSVAASDRSFSLTKEGEFPQSMTLTVGVEGKG